MNPIDAVGTSRLKPPVKEGNSNCIPCEGEKICSIDLDGLESPELLVDLHDARVLLIKTHAMLRFYGDVELSGKIGKKERGAMRKLAGLLKAYLEETALQWEFDDEEEEEVNASAS